MYSCDPTKIESNGIEKSEFNCRTGVQKEDQGSLNDNFKRRDRKRDTGGEHLKPNRASSPGLVEGDVNILKGLSKKYVKILT